MSESSYAAWLDILTGPFLAHVRHSRLLCQLYL